MKFRPLLKLPWLLAKMIAGSVGFCCLWIANEFLKRMPKHRRLVNKLERSQEATAGKNGLN